MFNLKRNNRSLEDFYALIEKEKIAKIGMTNVMKKFIAELPDNVKPSVQRKFTEHRKDHINEEIPNDLIEDLYSKARQIHNDKSKKPAPPPIFKVDETKSAEWQETISKQEDMIHDLQNQLDAYIIRSGE